VSFRLSAVRRTHFRSPITPHLTGKDSRLLRHPPLSHHATRSRKREFSPLRSPKNALPLTYRRAPHGERLRTNLTPRCRKVRFSSFSLPSHVPITLTR
jgi:hypothetical protein